MSSRSRMIRTVVAAAAACLCLAAGNGNNGDPVLYSHYKGLEAYGVTDAWALGFTGTGVKVAVIDSGIDFGTPDLQGAQARVEDPGSPYDGWPIVIDTYSLGEFQEKRSGGLSSIADTSATDTSGFKVPGTSRSGVYHIGNHPDRMLTGFHGGPVKVLVADEKTAGVYDTVYVDLDGNHDFTNDKPCRRGDEIAVWDRDRDGLSDESGGLLYFIADGTNPPPFGRLLYGEEARVPKAGEFVGFHFDTSSHGTMCAGTIAARGRIVKGIAPGATLIPVLGYSNNEMELCLIASLGYDGRPGTGDEADVISRSAGFTYFNKGADELSAFLDHLTTKIAPTTALVYAAGNEGSGYGTCSSPAGQYVITAGGIADLWWKDSTRRGDVINFSSRGPNVLGQVKPNVLGTGEFAPRVRPLASTHNGISAWDLNGGGTSNATPHVAGVVALIYDAYKKGHGRFPTSETARDIVMSTADDINEEVFAQGAGSLNARRAVEAAAGSSGVLFEPALFASGPVEADSTLEFAFKVTNPGRKALAIKPQKLFKEAESRFQIAAADDALLVPVDKANLDCDLLKISSIFPLDPIHKTLVDATGYWIFLYDWKDLNRDGRYADKLPARFEDAQPGELELLAISDWDHVITSEVRVHDPRARVSDGLVLGLKKNGEIKSRDATIVVERFVWRNWEGFDAALIDGAIRCKLVAPATSGVFQGKVLVEVAGEKTRRSIPVSFAAYAKEGIAAANGPEPYENLKLYGRLEGSGRFGFRDSRFFPFLHKGEELATLAVTWESSTSDVDLALFGPGTVDTAKMWKHKVKPPVDLPVLPVTQDNGHTPKRVEAVLGLYPATEKTLIGMLADGLNILVVNKANSSGTQYGETVGLRIEPLGSKVERAKALTARASEMVKVEAAAADMVAGFASGTPVEFREHAFDAKRGDLLLFKPVSSFYFPALFYDTDANGRFDEKKDDLVFRESGAVTLEPIPGDVVRLPYDGKYFVTEFSGDLFHFKERHPVTGNAVNIQAPQTAGAYVAVLEKAGNILPALLRLTVEPADPASVGLAPAGRVLPGRSCELKVQVKDRYGNAVKADLDAAVEYAKLREPVKIKIEAGQASLTLKAPDKAGPWTLKVRSRLGAEDVRIDVAKGSSIEVAEVSADETGLKVKLVNMEKAAVKASLSANPSWYLLPELAGRPELGEYAMFYRGGYVAGYLPYSAQGEVSLAAGEEREFTLPVAKLKDLGSYASRIAYIVVVSDPSMRVITWRETAPFGLTVSGFAIDPKVTKKFDELGGTGVKEPVSFLAEGLVSFRLNARPPLYFQPSLSGAVAVIPDEAGELRIRAGEKETTVKVAAKAAGTSTGEPDTEPPGKIEGVTAAFEKGEIKLTWKASKADDLDHYAVYRIGGETPRKVADVKVPEYTMKAELWNSYNFRVSALDKSGNEGRPSDPCGLVAEPPARPGTPLRAQEKLEPYLEVELERLEETYALLDRFAGEIWPGWSNYMDVEFTVQFPNLVFLLVGPRAKVPEGYRPVAGRTVRGKQVYLNTKDELPIKLAPPLFGGGGGGMTIRIRLQQAQLPPEVPAGTKKEASEEKGRKGKAKDPKAEPAVPHLQSESQIFLYVHEFFHGFQSQAWKDRGKGHDRDFTVTPEYAAFSEVEGTALLAAWKEKKRAKAIASVRDYLAAREAKHKFMSPEAISFEVTTSVSEGTATYSDTKMALLTKEKKYKTGVSHGLDPCFYDFKYGEDYFDEKIGQTIESVKGMTLDTLVKYYAYGALQCHLLDRLAPGWKKGFFSSGKNLDDVMNDRLGVSSGKNVALVEGFKTKYGFDEIFAKHAAVVKERNDAIDLIKNRKGRAYVVNIKATREFYMLQARGKSVRMGVEQIFLSGTQDFKMGDIEIIAADAPMHQLGLWDLEWIDTEAKPDVKGFSFEFKEKAGDVYKGLVFKCGGFMLKAPEAKIEESPDQVKVVILTKASRG